MAWPRWVACCSSATPCTARSKPPAPLLSKDNRELASVWVEAHLPERSRIAIEGYGCYVDRARYSVTALRKLDTRDSAWFRRHEDYLIFAGSSFNRFLDEPQRYKVRAQKYRRLFRDFELFKAFDDPSHGAPILIYRTHGASAAPSDG